MMNSTNERIKRTILYDMVNKTFLLNEIYQFSEYMVSSMGPIEFCIHNELFLSITGKLLIG